ncbi:c-type cytochrome [Phaeobacter sp. B1627]|uniref:c-type cytochrome n=1 Tax=Phaeobacter sp. B1627 TaxID=2583809 RepID=UPI00111860FD|nr:c-type cytochrome [Phaeobacter sp. B1627]TNJ44374.1 c-type cytochrome [Phaeobacter sp. B1627]
MKALVLALSLSATLAMGDEDGEFLTLKGHGGPVMAISVDRDGRVASGSFDNAVALWQNGSPTWLEAHDAAVTAVTLGADGDLFSAGDDFVIYRWSVHGATEIGRHAGKIRALHVSDDGRWLASAGWDGRIGIWPLGPLATGTPHMIEVGSGVNDVQFGPAGQLIAATATGEILVYEDPHAPARELVRQGFGINRLLISEQGWLVYGAVDGVTRAIDAETGAAIADFTLDRRPILALAHHPASGQIAVGDGQGYIMLIDTQTWRIARDFRAMREGPVWALAFAPDGGRIWAGGIHDLVYGWPVALMDQFDAVDAAPRSFLQDPETMTNGERQFMRKCSICHALSDTGARKAGPHLADLFGRRAGSLTGYRYSDTLTGSEIVWTAQTIDALFDLGPDHYIPGSKMPMQRITASADRQDLIDYLKIATNTQEDN